MAVAIRPATATKGPAKCRRKFLRFFPKGFYDEKYIDWERGYKWDAHLRWEETLGRETHRTLIADGDYGEVARRAVGIESRTNLLFSFEKMALRDAVKAKAGAKAFAEGLYEFLYGRGTEKARFERWCAVVGTLPEAHFFMKPMVTRTAAQEYGFELDYKSRPNWESYSNLLEFARVVSRDLRDLRPRDMMDSQSFLWVQGSDEYEE